MSEQGKHQVALERAKQRTELAAERKRMVENNAAAAQANAAIGTAACTVASSFLGVVKTGMDMFKTVAGKTSFDRVTAIKKQDGFSRFYLQTDTMYIGKISQDHVARALIMILRRYCGFKAGCPKAMLSMYEVEEIDLFRAEEFTVDTFLIDFEGGLGVSNQGQIIVQYDHNNYTASICFFRLDGQFALAPNMILEDHGRGSWLRSREFQTISYEPRALTEADVDYISDRLTCQMQGRLVYLQSLVEKPQ